VASHIICNEAADPSRKAVRDDRILGYLNCVIPNPALSGEESAFPYTLVTAADCVMLARDEWVAVDLSDYAMQVE
jgi:hypothetical protein